MKEDQSKIVRNTRSLTGNSGDFIVLMEGCELSARIVEDPVFANMEGSEHNARNVEDPEFANMEGEDLAAKTVEEVRSVNTDGNDVHVPSAPTRQFHLPFVKYVLPRY